MHDVYMSRGGSVPWCLELVNSQQMVNAEIPGKASKTGVEGAESLSMGGRSPNSLYSVHKLPFREQALPYPPWICFSNGSCMRPGCSSSFQGLYFFA